MNPTNNINSVPFSLNAAPHLGPNSSIAPTSVFSSNLSDSALSTITETHSGLRSVITSDPANPNLNISGPVQNLGQLHHEEFKEELMLGFVSRPSQAVRHYGLAANQGNSAAQYRMARAYEIGDLGLVRSPSEALRLFRLAAEQGHSAARFRLARAYECGDLGLEENPSEALRLYRLAAEQGNSAAQYRMARAYEIGDLGLEESPSDALRLYRLAVDRGESAAQNRLACAYKNGELGLEKCPSEAVRLFRIAAEKGYSAAQYRLAQAYEHGWLGLEKSPSHAVSLYCLAADQIPDAQYRLASAYENGELGLKNNLEHAEIYYIKAANLGYVSAEYRLANAYCDGSLGKNKIDHSKTLQYLIKRLLSALDYPNKWDEAFVQMAVLARDMNKQVLSTQLSSDMHLGNQIYKLKSALALPREVTERELRLLKYLAALDPANTDLLGVNPLELLKRLAVGPSDKAAQVAEMKEGEITPIQNEKAWAMIMDLQFCEDPRLASEAKRIVIQEFAAHIGPKWVSESEEKGEAYLSGRKKQCICQIC